MVYDAHCSILHSCPSRVGGLDILCSLIFAYANSCMHYVLGVSGLSLLSSWLGTLYLTCVPYYCVVAFPGVRFPDVFLYQDHGEFLSIHASFSLGGILSKVEALNK